MSSNSNETENFITKGSFIKNSFLNESLALKSKFKVVISFKQLPTPTDNSLNATEELEFAMKALGIDEETFMWNASAVALPQYSLSLKRSEVLNQQRILYSKREFQDLKISFIESNDNKLRAFFNYWLNLGYNEKTFKRSFYPDDLACQIKIYPLGEFGKKNDYCETFIDASPYLINDLNYDISDEDAALVLTEITFSFKKQMIEHDGIEQLKKENKNEKP